jgi:putative acetyltransferase
MSIRVEAESDRGGVRAVNLAAFDSPAEADLVEALRQQAQPFVSLVAEQDGVVVGHVMFSPVSLSNNTDLKVMGLGPMAVAPANQKGGIGSALVRAGLAECKNRGFVAVVVLGHPKYYPRFGFSPASQFEIYSEYDVPDDVFMAMELQPKALSEGSGVVRYHTAFNNV